MSVESSNGSSSGVNYCMKLDKKGWYATHEWRIHRVFLDTKNQRLTTPIFDFAESRWQLSIEHTSSGALSVYLHTKDRRRATVHFGFALVNFSDEKLTKRLEKRTVYQPSHSNWGTKNLASVFEVKDPASGFWLGDSLVLQTSIRIVQPENELGSVSASGNSVTYKWSLKKIKEKSPFKLDSEEIPLGRMKWKLFAHPHGWKGSDDLSFYVFNCSEQGARINLEVRVVNHAYPAKTCVKSFSQTIGAKQSLGWEHLLPARALEDESMGFLQGSWITFIVLISLDGRPALA